jgi:hypothetical protein
MSDEFDFEFSRELGQEEQLAKIAAKVEIAKMLMERGKQLADEAENDIKFYRITEEI